ncbi:MAG: divergent polysaccharide deacetylase family protein [Rubricella sp.]
MAAKTATGGGGFFKGFLGGALVSVLALGAVAVVNPIEPDVAVDTPDLPAVAVPGNDTDPGDRESAARPAVSEPASPGGTPAVDPSVDAEGAVIENGGEAGDAPALAGGSAAVETRPGIQSPQTTARPQVETQAGLSGTGNPNRVSVGGGGTPQGLSVSVPESSGAIPRPSNSSLDTPQRPRNDLALLTPPADERPGAPAPVTAPDPTVPVPDVEIPTEPIAEDMAPRNIYAAEFNYTGNRPLLSVILIDAGEEGVDIAALADLQFPVTFAVPANAPDAIARTQSYRAAGFEVVALVPDGRPGDLSGQSRDDIEARLVGFLTNVPEAVGLMDRLDGDLPRDDGATRSALEVVNLTGHLLVTHREQGFNRVDSLADVMGVPSATVTRVLPSNGDAAAIRAGLDRAAVAARSNGGAVVVGRTDSATLTTLFTWVLSTSTRAVDLAPVTALVQRLENN